MPFEHNLEVLQGTWSTTPQDSGSDSGGTVDLVLALDDEDDLSSTDEPSLLFHEQSMDPRYVLTGVGSQFPAQITDGTHEEQLATDIVADQMSNPSLTKATMVTTCESNNSFAKQGFFWSVQKIVDAVLVWIGRILDRIQGLIPRPSK